MANASHSSLGPSSAERWFSCPGSVNLCAVLPPSRPNEYAAEGTVAHGLAEKFVMGDIDTLELMGMIGTEVKKDGFDIEITDEMVDAVVDYADMIERDRKELEATPGSAAVVHRAEVRVKAHTISGDLWGTCDYLLYKKGKALFVYDFKYGKGVVEAEENKQIAIYAIAAMDTEAGEAFDKVVSVIFQPRARHEDGIERRWEAPVSWFKEFRTQLTEAVKRTEDPLAQLVAGDHCKWCPAKASCPAIAKSIENTAALDFAVVPRTPPDVKSFPNIALMPIEKLAAALEWEDAINSWYEALKERAREVLSAGGEVPGYKLVDGRSNRKWVSEAAVVAQFGPTLGEKLYEKKILSPAKLEKVVGKGKLENLGLVFKPEAPKAIAPLRDPRPVARSSAAEDFKPAGTVIGDINKDILGVSMEQTRKEIQGAVDREVINNCLQDDLLGELAGPTKRMWP